MLSCEKKDELNIGTKSNDTIKVFEDEVSATDSTLASTTSCYMMANIKDSVWLQIDDNLGTIVGKMIEKRDNKLINGELMGISIDDTLKLEYTSTTDSLATSKELWFLKKDGKLFPATTSEPSKYKAKNIKFDDSDIFKPIDCKDLINR